MTHLQLNRVFSKKECKIKNIAVECLLQMWVYARMSIRGLRLRGTLNQQDGWEEGGGRREEKDANEKGRERI